MIIIFFHLWPECGQCEKSNYFNYNLYLFHCVTPTMLWGLWAIMAYNNGSIICFLLFCNLSLMDGLVHTISVGSVMECLLIVPIEEASQIASNLNILCRYSHITYLFIFFHQCFLPRRLKLTLIWMVVNGSCTFCNNSA